MMLSVKDVLNIDLMQKSKVLTPQVHLDQIHVESISVIEIPVDNFVRKNEFVLSTAIGCGDNPAILKQFVQDIIHSEAAALAIAVGHYVSHIPDEVIQLAENNQFPIIEIPWELRFSEVINAVLSEINKWHQTALQRSDEIQKELLNLFLRKSDLTQAAEVIHQKFTRPILIMDQDGALKGRSKNSNNLLKLWEKHSSSSLSWKLIKHAHHSSKTEIQWLELSSENMLKISIQSTQIIQGYLLFSIPPDTSIELYLSNEIKAMLEHAATTTSLWFQRENTIKETEMRLRDDFVWSLTKEDVDSWEIVQSRAKMLGFHIDLPYVCLIGLPENAEDVFQQGHEEVAYEYWLPNTIREIEERILNTGKQLQQKIMTTYQQSKFIIFLEVTEQELNKTIHTFLDEIEADLEKLFPRLIMSWGIGENHVGIRTFRKSFHDAAIALEIGSRQKGIGRRNTYASTGIYRILQYLSHHDEIRIIVGSTLSHLVEYDRERGLDLIHTLMVYIRNLSNVSQTSRELNLHRQSLLYRLGKIETLTSLSLTDSDDLFLLDLCVKLWTTGHFDDQNI
jgi:purine catabolism regulator